MNASLTSLSARRTLEMQPEVQRVHVRAASRLHFGLFSWGGAGRQFGGAGVMVREPGLELCGERANEFSVEGPGQERIAAFCDQWMRFCGLSRRPALHWRIVRPPVEHVGLGSGTQLGLAVASILFRFHGCEKPATQELALSVARGLRSAIGAHGFQQGGLIVEPGKQAEEPLSPLGRRVSLPAAWRVVLVRPRVECGLHGAAEKSAFAALPPVPASVSSRLRILADDIADAGDSDDFDRFSHSLWEYGTLAGGCFAPVQGGPFNGPVLTQLVDRLRSLGAVGVGQSSWGPTLFAFQRHEDAAKRLLDELQTDYHVPLDAAVTSIDNDGARIDATCA